MIVFIWDYFMSFKCFFVLFSILLDTQSREEREVEVKDDQSVQVSGQIGEYLLFLSLIFFVFTQYIYFQ